MLVLFFGELWLAFQRKGYCITVRRDAGKNKKGYFFYPFLFLGYFLKYALCKCGSDERPLLCKVDFKKRGTNKNDQKKGLAFFDRLKKTRPKL